MHHMFAQATVTMYNFHHMQAQPVCYEILCTLYASTKSSILKRVCITAVHK